MITTAAARHACRRAKISTQDLRSGSLQKIAAEHHHFGIRMVLLTINEPDSAYANTSGWMTQGPNR